MSDSAERLAAALADRYDLRRELGAGGMATVYLAEDTKLRREVAIKVLRPALAAVLGAERFLKEIDVTANLQHPNILPLHDSGEADGFLYYVMPYVEGESLRDKLHREKQLGIEESIKIAEGVAAALDYAHRQGVIHRDIKPENILLRDGQALVADFGIALAVTAAGGARLTETGLSIGTPQYMSPEQAAGDRELDKRSDIYSLGCVLYEMLAGEPPHTGPTLQAILAKVATDEPRDLAEVRRSVPDGVCDAVHQALARLPADRFAQADTFAEALRDPSRRTGRGPRHQAAAAARWKRIAVSSLAVGALAVAGVLAPLFQNSEPGASSVQWLNLDLENPIVSSIALTPDGSAIIYTGGGMRVRSLDAPGEHTLEFVGPPTVSPDGGWVAGLSNDHGLTKVPITGGPRTMVLRPPWNVFLYGIDWGPDDYIYFTAGHADGISRVDANGTTPPELLTVVDSTAGELGHRFPSATDHGVLFTSWWGDSARIMAYTFATGSVTRVVAGTAARVLGDDYLLFGTLNGWIRAVRFDAERLQPVGPSIAVLDSVQVDAYGRAWFDVSANGTLAYLPAWTEQRSLVAVDSAGRERPFVRERDQYRYHEISPDGSAVAYTRVVAGAAEIWVRSRDGQASRVTRRGTNMWPIWSPDGTHLVFNSDRGGRGLQLYRQRANGSGDATVALERPDGTWPMSWSRNGLIAGHDNVAMYWIIQADSSGAEPPPIWCAPRCGGWMRLSPDGKHIAWWESQSPSGGRIEGQNWVARLDDPVATRVPISGSDRGGYPRWSPDGRRVYYRTWGTGQLVSVTLDLDDPIRILDRRVLFNTLERGFRTEWLHFAFDPASGDPVFSRPDGPPQPSLAIVLDFEAELEARFRGR